MINVKLIYSKGLSDPTGASTVMRSHADNCDYYAKNGVKLDVLARDTIFKSAAAVIAQRQKKNLRFLFTDFIGRMSSKSPTAEYFYQYIRSIRPAIQFNNILGSYIADNDILFFNEMIPCYYYLTKYGKGNHKIVAMFHNDGEDFTAEKNKTLGFDKSWVFKKYMKMQDIVINQVDRLGFVSENAASRFIELHPQVTSSKVFYIQNGMNLYPERIVKSVSTLDIVCVGTVNDRKRQETIVRALIKAQQNNLDIDNVHFTIVGGGDRLDFLKQLSEEHNLQRYITFVGSSNDVDKFLNNANIFILPSGSEGLPMAILEAMRMSLPIVSTRTGGIPETIIDGETGLLIESSVEGVYGFLSHINDYDWVKMGKASYQYFQNKFTVEKMLDSYIELFKSL
jgi:glycosyltransferase involved in cell wall biosynthesis